MTTTRPNNPGWGPLWRDFVCNPAAQHYQKLRNGCLWLYLVILASANHRTGKWQTSWSAIAADTGLAEAHVRSMAGHLRHKGYVNVHPEGENHVLFVVQGWRPLVYPAMRSAARLVSVEQDSDGTYRVQPGTPPLATKIAKALDADEYIEAIVDIVNEYPEQVIRSKLAVVERVPSAKIRVSRFALFRYLLTKHHDEDDDTIEDDT